MLKDFVSQTRVYPNTKTSYRDIDGLLRFHWDILTICNYHCEYCYRRAEPGWGKILKTEKILSIIKTIDTLNNPFEMIYLGGEPTLHPGFEKILMETYNSKNIYSFAVITNLNDIKPRHIELYKKINDKLIINATFHPSQCDINKFKENLLKLNEVSTICVNNMLISPEYKQKTYDITDFMIKNNISFTDNIPFKANIYSANDSHNFMDESHEYKQFIKEYITNFNLFKNLIFNFKDKKEIMSDAECFLKGYNNLEGVLCENNNFQISIDGEISQMCTDTPLKIEDIASFNICIKCPKKTCVCQGLLSGRKYV